MNHGQQMLWVGVGGAIGAVGRYGLLQWLGTVDDGYLPWGTLVANISGSLLLGIVVGIAERGSMNRAIRLFLTVGLLGGFTTFSFFSYENLELLRGGQFLQLFINVSIQVVVGLGSAALGYLAGHRIR